jgi:hypothetical protein
MPTVTMTAFEIEITKQGWLGPPQADLCSHGDLRLTIGGEIIAAGDGGENEYGISESALALLRTLESDHSREHPVAERLVFHGCGLILMMGCPIGIDWSVVHADGQVLLTDIVKYTSTSESDALRFHDLAVRLPEDSYRAEVIRFAKRAKAFFEGVAKDFDDDYARAQHLEFWDEFNARLERDVAAS